MLDREELQQAVVEAELGHHWNDIERIVRPAIYLDSIHTQDSECAIGISKSGGIPDVPPDFIWPEDEDGPCIFLMQINLEQLASYDVEGLLPKSGLLSFFYNADGMTGGIGALYKDPVFYFPASTELRRATPVYDGEYRDEAYYESCIALSLYSGWSFPRFDEFKLNFASTPTYAENLRLDEFLEKPTQERPGIPSQAFSSLPHGDYRQQYPNRYLDHGNCHLLGHPDDYQGGLEPKAGMAYRYPGRSYWHLLDSEKDAYHQEMESAQPQAYADWLCLLHVNDSCGYGSVFTLDYLIHREDLAKADFSKTVAFAVK